MRPAIALAYLLSKLRAVENGDNRWFPSVKAFQIDGGLSFCNVPLAVGLRLPDQ